MKNHPENAISRKLETLENMNVTLKRARAVEMGHVPTRTHF